MAKAAKDIEHQMPKPKGSGKGSSKSSSKTAAAAAAAPNSTTFTKKRIETAKPNSQAPMLASDFDESNYLKGTDIDLGAEEEVTIDSVTIETLGDDDDQKKKPCLRFRELDRGLILNKTNRDVLAVVLGNDMLRWPGHRVVLFSQMVPFKGKQHQAMRLRMPTPKGSGGPSGLRRKG